MLDKGLIMRFCKGRQFNYTDARRLIEEDVRWRKATFPIYASEVRDELAKMKYVSQGRDIKGRRILYIVHRRMGPSTYTSLDHHFRAVAYALEVFNQLVLKPDESWVIIFDRVDSNSDNVDIGWARAIASMLTAHNPERMAATYIVPAR
jgi:hypothetical protein